MASASMGAFNVLSAFGKGARPGSDNRFFIGTPVLPEYLFENGIRNTLNAMQELADVNTVMTFCHDHVYRQYRKGFAHKTDHEEETEAFFNGDMERLATTHVRDETNIRMTATRSGYTYHEGWDEVRAFFQDYFDNELEPGDFYEVKKNYKIKVYGDAAWAVYDNEYYNEDDELLSTSIHAQFLEKVDGKWKLVFYSSIYDSTWEKSNENELE